MNDHIAMIGGRLIMHHNRKQEEDNFQQSYNKLAARLLYRTAESNDRDNTIVSPLSVIMLLAIAADASQGTSRQEIVNAIAPGLSYDEFGALLSTLQKQFSYDEAIVSSNAVCVQHDFASEINPDYATHLNDVFGGKLFSSRNLADDVNAWVKEQTNGMIDYIANEDMRNAVACLLNAIAFSATWDTPYFDINLNNREFHNVDGSDSQVTMLVSSENRYIENADFTGFTRPYQNGRFVFMALLPKKKGSDALLNAVERTDFTRLFRGYNRIPVSEDSEGSLPISAEYIVHAWLPEFTTDFRANLEDFCKSLGINTVFSQSADFSPMSSAPLMIDQVIHGAHIEVDWQGTRAAASTYASVLVGSVPTSFPTIVEVHLNRPFVYAIMDTDTGLPVFIGVCNRICPANDLE